MYFCLINNTKKFIERYNYNLPTWEDKPFYIEDAYNQIGLNGKRINLISSYKLLQKGIKSVRAYRQPIIGILTSDPNLNFLITKFSKTLNLNVVNLGTLIKDKQSPKLLKFLDIILATSEVEGINDLYKNCKKRKIPWLIKSYILENYISKYIGIVCDSSNQIGVLSTLLYFIRPINHILGGIFTSYPLEYIGQTEQGDLKINPVNNNLEYIQDFEEVYGYLIECNQRKYLEIIDI